MQRLLLALVFVIVASGGYGQQNFVVVAPEPQRHAWWLRAEFYPFHTEIRGIPVAEIDRNWCRATEFTEDLVSPRLFTDDGLPTMAEAGFAFAVEGYFDDSQVKQTALVGVYETCAGEKGDFMLILDQGSNGLPTVRYLLAQPNRQPFSMLQALPDGSLAFAMCMDCDAGGTIKWNKAKGRFVFRLLVGEDEN
jgi:hypothetical protein